MKDLMRAKCLISTEIENLLNQQIKKEAQSSSIYLSMASWCNRNGLDGSSTYFFRQSEDERHHELKLFKYVLDMGGTAISPEVTKLKIDYHSLREIFEDTLEQEVSVTQSIKNIVNACHKETDYVTAEFLNWFLKEQREEEYVVRRALELFDLIGEEGRGLWDIDRHIASIKYEES